MRIVYTLFLQHPIRLGTWQSPVTVYEIKLIKYQSLNKYKWSFSGKHLSGGGVIQIVCQCRFCAILGPIQTTPEVRKGATRNNKLDMSVVMLDLQIKNKFTLAHQISSRSLTDIQYVDHKMKKSITQTIKKSQILQKGQRKMDD